MKAETGYQGPASILIDVPSGSIPEIIKKTTSDLEALNISYGNMLFASLGKDNGKAFLFATPKTIAEHKEFAVQTIKSQFLVFTVAEGFKIIESGTDKKSARDVNWLSELIANRIGANPAEIHNIVDGYEANKLEIMRTINGGNIQTVSVTPKGKDTRYERSGYVFFNGTTSSLDQTLKLAEASEESVREILELNLTRVKNIQKAVGVTTEFVK